MGGLDISSNAPLASQGDIGEEIIPSLGHDNLDVIGW
jgi:hypothetical protein